jgi:dihydrofolate reductase
MRGEAMRKVVLYHLTSVDGVSFEEPADWFDDDSPEVFSNLTSIIESQDDVLLGRGTYDYWVGYWPTSDVEPFASFINTTRKHVITSSKPSQEWGRPPPVGRRPACSERSTVNRLSCGRRS